MPSISPSPPKSELDYLKEMNDSEPSETPSATDYAKYPVKPGSQLGGARLNGGLWDGITNFVNHNNNMMTNTRKRKNRRGRKTRR